MPRNTGERPTADTCDIRFRNGEVVRGVNPFRWRWTLHDPAYPPLYAFDIIEWQPVRKGTA